MRLHEANKPPEKKSPDKVYLLKSKVQKSLHKMCVHARLMSSHCLGN